MQSHVQPTKRGAASYNMHTLKLTSAGDVAALVADIVVDEGAQSGQDGDGVVMEHGPLLGWPAARAAGVDGGRGWTDGLFSCGSSEPQAHQGDAGEDGVDHREREDAEHEGNHYSYGLLSFHDQ